MDPWINDFDNTFMGNLNQIYQDKTFYVVN